MGKPRVLILGGGFGGMYAALKFEHMLARGGDVDVNRNNFFSLHPNAARNRGERSRYPNIVSLIRKLLRRATFFHEDIESIDLANT